MKTPPFSRVVRRAHMYLALFLTPWMIIYALSSLIFNHFNFVRQGLYDGKISEFVLEQEMDYDVAFSADMTERDIGAHILADLGLSGTYNVRGHEGQKRLVIHRLDPVRPWRVLYFPEEKRLRLERDKLTAASFLTRMHTRAGYHHGTVASVVFALTLDLVIVTMLFWVASGLWMWWEIKPARRPGAAFGLAGVALFGLFFFTI